MSGWGSAICRPQPTGNPRPVRADARRVETLINHIAANWALRKLALALNMQQITRDGGCRIANDKGRYRGRRSAWLVEEIARLKGDQPLVR